MNDLVDIIHFVDETITWDERLALEQLLDRLPADVFSQQVVVLGQIAGELVHIDTPMRRVHTYGVPRLSFARSAHKLRRSDDMDIVHCWGQDATQLWCSIPNHAHKVVVSFFDPRTN